LASPLPKLQAQIVIADDAGGRRLTVRKPQSGRSKVDGREGLLALLFITLQEGLEYTVSPRGGEETEELGAALPSQLDPNEGSHKERL